MKSSVIAVLILIVSFVLAVHGLVAAKGPSTGASDHPWQARLESLRPDLPMGYFELAEEIADHGDSEESEALARHLFAMAALLDPLGLGRSSCLALADLAEDEREERRLRALASLLRTPGWSADFAPDIAGEEQSVVVSPATALIVSEAIGFYRSGQGARATSRLRESGATELLTVHERHIPGGIRRFLEDCRHYRGRLRPTLMERESLRLLELEEALLMADDPSWSAALLLRQGDPMIDVDPHRLADTLGVDASRPYYRRGQWSAGP